MLIFTFIKIKIIKKRHLTVNVQMWRISVLVGMRVTALNHNNLVGLG